MNDTTPCITASTDAPPRGHKTRSKPRPRWAFAAILPLAGGLLVFLWRQYPNTSERQSISVPPVAVAKVDLGNLAQTLKVAAEFRPYQQVSLHAKVAGYLQSISVDIGDHVKEGQALAQLDVPELKNDLEKDFAAVRASEQEVERLQANYDEAHLACQRLLSVVKQHPKLVAQQEVDVAQAKDRSTAGALASARQHVEEATAQLHTAQALLSFATITAPFDGVITKRYADPGALIQAGTSSNTQTMPLVDIDQDTRLRLVFPVPESAVARLQVGASVQVFVSSLHQTFDGKVSRFSGKVDRATRTMPTEVEVNNDAGHFKPGMYAEATLVLEQRKHVLTAPIAAISFGEHPSTLMVDQNSTVQLRPVTLGLQTPTTTEILEGLKPGDLVIVGSRTGIQPGQKVTPKQVMPAANE